MNNTTYQLSRETIRLLESVRRYESVSVKILFGIMLILHFLLSGIFLFLGYASLFLFLLITFALCVGIILIYYITSVNEHRYSSYEIDLTDDSVALRQTNKSFVKIHKDNITQIQEIVPEGGILIQGKKKGEQIEIYALLLKDHPEIKEHLAKWGILGKVTLFKIQFQYLIIILGCAFIAPVLLFFALYYPYMFISGLWFLGYGIIAAFVTWKWPICDARIKQILWIIVIPTLISALFCMVFIFLLVYQIILAI